MQPFVTNKRDPLTLVYSPVWEQSPFVLYQDNGHTCIVG